AYRRISRQSGLEAHAAAITLARSPPTPPPDTISSRWNNHVLLRSHVLGVHSSRAAALSLGHFPCEAQLQQVLPGPPHPRVDRGRSSGLDAPPRRYRGRRDSGSRGTPLRPLQPDE